MKAKDYFNKQAKNYHKERSGGPIGSLVKKEKKLVLQLLNPKKGEKILDAGCGSGYFSIIIKDKGANIFGVDISPNMINELRKRGIEGKVANIEELSLKRKFDKMLCAGALEFTKHPQKVFQSFSKNLKEGGILTLVYPRNSPAGYAYKLFHFLHGVNITLFPKRKIKHLAKNSGFELVCMKKAHPISNVALFKKVV